MIGKSCIRIGETTRLHLCHAAIPARGAQDLPMMMRVMPRMVPGVIGTGVPPCAMVRPCRCRSSGNGDRRRTQSQRNQTKRPAERKQLNHNLSSMTHPQAPRAGRSSRSVLLLAHDIFGKLVSTFPDHALRSYSNERAVVLRCGVWREEDFMRQRGNDFGVIPRSFHDQKESNLPHCGPEN